MVFGTPLHEALATVLAARSHAEVVRARHRVLVAMRMQTIEQGRYLGGRPPYGYQLVDDGPHPNRAMGRRGVRLQRLSPDPATAPAVRWMFAERLAGRSVAGIARALNEQKVAGPSSVDPGRNRHRTRRDWSLRTVTEILANPRYTGYQVWNRTSADRSDLSPSGRRPTVRNERQDWVVSARIAHPPLVSEQDFLAVQAVRARRVNARGGTHSYLLTSRLQCGLCGRRMESYRVHDRAGYRCRHGHSSARTRNKTTLASLYLREDLLLDRIADLLTCAALAAAPTREQTVQVVHRLDLEFRCEPGTVALLDHAAQVRRRKPPSRETVEPPTSQITVEPSDDNGTKVDPLRSETSDDSQLTLDLAFEPEPTHPSRPKTTQRRNNPRTSWPRAARLCHRARHNAARPTADQRPTSPVQDPRHSPVVHNVSPVWSPPGSHQAAPERSRESETTNPTPPA
jgi:site-specific DNA recombinase